MHPALDINNYLSEGFQKLCDVENGDNRYGTVYHGKFYYTNINKDLMFSKHRSWVYLIVDNGKIVKVGETGNPLGIRKSNGCSQPRWSTECRMGRLAAFKCNTDGRIRQELYDSCNNGTVSIYVKKCEQSVHHISIAGKSSVMSLSYHKDLEMAILDHIMEQVGYLPTLNQCRK